MTNLKQLKEEAKREFENFIKTTQVDNKIIHHVSPHSGDYIGYLDGTFIPDIAYLDFEDMDAIGEKMGYKIEYHRNHHEYIEYKI